MKVNIRQISEITGFSPATVSNALNKKRGVNAETAAKIWRTAEELGYFEENKLSKVKFVMFKKCGYIVEDTPFFPQMIASTMLTIIPMMNGIAYRKAVLAGALYPAYFPPQSKSQ